MNIKSLASTFVDKSDGFSHMSDGFSKDDYRDFIGVVRKRLSSAKWSDFGETEFDLEFKGSNFYIVAYLQDLTISVVVKFLNDKHDPVSVSGFGCKLDISEVYDTGELYAMFTKRAVGDSVLRSFQKVYSLEEAYDRLSGVGSVNFNGLRMSVSDEQLSFDNVMYGSVPFPQTFEGFEKVVSEYKNRKG